MQILWRKIKSLYLPDEMQTAFQIDLWYFHERNKVILGIFLLPVLQIYCVTGDLHQHEYQKNCSTDDTVSTQHFGWQTHNPGTLFVNWTLVLSNKRLLTIKQSTLVSIFLFYSVWSCNMFYLVENAHQHLCFMWSLEHAGLEVWILNTYRTAVESNLCSCVLGGVAAPLLQKRLCIEWLPVHRTLWGAADLTSTEADAQRGPPKLRATPLILHTWSWPFYLLAEGWGASSAGLPDVVTASFWKVYNCLTLEVFCSFWCWGHITVEYRPPGQVDLPHCTPSFIVTNL